MAGAILLFLHIAAGSIALLAALVALVAAKGRRYHILLGRVYAIAMTVIFLTSLPLALEAPGVHYCWGGVYAIAMTVIFLTSLPLAGYLAPRARSYFAD